MKHLPIAAIVLTLSNYPIFAAEDDSAPTPDVAPGKILFEKHGCTNCHGPDGIHPESKYVPVLRGKSADYIFQQASAIFSGEKTSGNTQFMHDQFCIGEVNDEGCYALPSTQDLHAIASWLSAGELPEKKQTQQGLYVTSAQAYDQLERLGNKALLLDVRTRAEIAFLGMPERVDANIPYMTVGNFDEWDDKKQTFKLRPNSVFTARVNELIQSRSYTKDTPIFLICRSGNRSAKAANLLKLAGYTNVYTVTDGFEGDKAKSGARKGERVVNGWKNAGLPWSYKLPKERMYWDL